MPAPEILLYTLASGAALLVDAGILTLLVKWLGAPYLWAATASFVTGGVFLYVLSVRMVFRFRRIPNPALELPVFLALGLVGLAVNLTVMWVAVESLHVHYLVAKGSASACTFAMNFLLRRNVMFSRAPMARAAK